MVARTRSTLRNTSQLSNELGPSVKAKNKTKKTKTKLQDLSDAHSGTHVLQLADGSVFSPKAGPSFLALHSTPLANRNVSPDVATLSSPLPPSSPLATSSVNHAEERKADSFGFFATQKKLEEEKAMMKKTGKSRKKYKVYDDSDIEDMYATDEEYDSGMVLVPTASTMAGQPSRTSQDEARTSNKRRNERKLDEYVMSTPGSSTPRLPLSPSPTRPPVPQASSAVTIKGKGMKGRSKKMAATNLQQSENGELDPSMLMKHLEGLLPKNPVKRQVRRTAKKRNAEDLSDAGPGEQQTGKIGKRAPVDRDRKKPASSNKKRRKDEGLGLGLDEEQEKARRERIEYFKRLDEYELAKENVYVV